MITILRERRRWLITGLLFFMSAIAFLDRQTLSVLEKTLEAILGFSEIEYSNITTGFLIATGLGYLFAGRLVERFGTRLSFAVALTVWSTAAVLHSLAAGWISLLVLRVILGLGESLYTPTAAKVLKEWIPTRERGVSWAIFSAGNFVGAMIAPVVVGALTERYNWRFSFAATGASGFALLCAWLWLYDSPERHRLLSVSERTLILTGRGSAPASAGKVSALRLLRNPVILGFFFTRFFTDSYTFFFQFWMQPYFQTSLGYTFAKVGLIAWIPFFGADLGALSGGALSDWLVRRGVDPRRARQRIMLAVACLMPLTLLVVQVSWTPLAVGLIVMVMFLQACWNTNLTTLIVETTPPHYVAAVVALSLMGGTLGGSISTFLTGRVIKAFGYVPVFTVLGFVHVTAFAIMSAGLRSAERRRESRGGDWG